MASKAKLTAFNKKVIKHTLKLGGKVTIDKAYVTKLELETKAGLVSITLFAPDMPSDLFTVFTRFEDVKKANEVLKKNFAFNYNKHSGKNNYHFSDEENCLNTFYMDMCTLTEK